PPDEANLRSAEEAISSSWYFPTLKSGWIAANGTTPAVGITSTGIIVFRGAVKKDPNKNPGNVLFDLPSNLSPANPDFIDIPIALGALGNGLGMLIVGCSQGTGQCTATVSEDGVGGAGAKAFAMTSLDGASFDRTSADSQPLALGTDWGARQYPFRNQGTPFELPAGVKKVGGFVRFQGALVNNTGSANTAAFQLPSGYIPGQNVYVPVVLGPNSSAAHGRLAIMGTSGIVYVQIEGSKGSLAEMTSLEGASFSLTTTPTSLSLQNGWVAYSARAVKVRNEEGVIRLEGAVKNGTNVVVANLPQGMRPAQTIYVVADAINAAHMRLKIERNGNISVDSGTLSSAQGFLSLDGVSFAL
ncbi:MAG TPA: hypothetical protein VFK05_15915, partial [Polyangiaceae bacterium]|nr:hypothetical protein [Polyangiaceae bacterium]